MKRANSIQKDKGLTVHLVTRKDVTLFLLYLREHCPAYPEGGSLKLSTWTKIGKYIYKEPRAPISILQTWQSLMSALTLILPSDPDVSLCNPDAKSPDPTIAITCSPPDYASSCPSAPLKLMPREPQSGEPLSSPPSPPICPPSPPILNSFQKAFAAGDMSAEELSCFPMMMHAPAGGIPAPHYVPMDWEIMKELKSATVKYGVRSPYVRQLLENISSQHHILFSEWQSMASMLLGSAALATWHNDYRLAILAAQSAGLPPGVTLDHLLCQGTVQTPRQEITIGLGGYAIMRNAALNAFRRLPDPNKPTQTFNSILQGPSEPYASFIDRLSEALNRQIDNEHAQAELLAKLSVSNANSDCQKILKPLQALPGQTIADFIRACQEVGTESHRSQALASALSATMALATPRHGNCFNCGKPGHFKNQCRAPGGGAASRSISNMAPKTKPKTICPRCRKGFHWASQCRSNPPPSQREEFSPDSQQQGN